MADTTGKSIWLAQQSNRQSRVIIEKTILFGRCNECSFRCGNAAMRTWQGRTYSRLTMPAGFTDQQPGGTRATTISFEETLLVNIMANVKILFR